MYFSVFYLASPKSPEAELREKLDLWGAVRSGGINLCWLAAHLRLLSTSAHIETGSWAFGSHWMTLPQHLETWSFWRKKTNIGTSRLHELLRGLALKALNPTADTATLLWPSLMSGSQKELSSVRIRSHAQWESESCFSDVTHTPWAVGMSGCARGGVERRIVILTFAPLALSVRAQL